MVLPEPVQEFHIRRNHVLEDVVEETRKNNYHPQNRVSTWFVGEVGRDTGGLTRELWQLFAREIERLCDGHLKIFRHDAAKLHVSKLCVVDF